MTRRQLPVIPDAIVGRLLDGADPPTAFAKDSMLDEVKKALAEHALNAEMDQHLAGSQGHRHMHWRPKDKPWSASNENLGLRGLSRVEQPTLPAPAWSVSRPG